MAGYDIQNAARFLLEINDDFQSDCLVDDIFCEKDIKTTKTFSQVPDHKWTDKMLSRAWAILLKYSEHLGELDVDLNELSAPSGFNINDEEIKNDFEIDSDYLILPNYVNVNELNIPNDEHSNNRVKINLGNALKVQNELNKNSKRIPPEILKQINLMTSLESYKPSKVGDLIPMSNLNCDLLEYQKTGVSYLCLNKRAMLADDMGLGKTIQSLAACEQVGKFPVVIVCPSSLKLNWLQEIKKVSNRTSELISKKSEKSTAEYFVINYESVVKYIALIKKLNPSVIIFDESHYLKNSKAKRTKACLEISQDVEYIFSLTGTPILNKPSELISQLEVLGRLSNFGGYWNFIQKYCGAKNTDWGWDHSGATNLKELSNALHSSCMLRRLKENVLPDLPRKRRTKLPISLKSKKDYEKELNQYLDFTSGSSYSKAIQISKLESLRKYVAMSKLPMVNEWISNMVEQNQKVVVFTYHIDVQEELIKEFPAAATILSKDKQETRQANVDRFQNDPDCKIIICSLRTAAVGITLTAASNVAFVETDWTPSVNDQAEDRCHRIGQSDSVNAWYFIVEGTIEEYIWNVLERKRELVESVMVPMVDEVIEAINKESSPQYVLDI